MALVIYEWEAWHGFLLARAFPEAIRLPAHPDEDAAAVLDRLPSGASAFAFHLNVTFGNAFPRDRANLVRGLVSRGIVPLNAGVVDISKRAIQAQCAALGLPVAAARRDGDPDERVIVKSNHNYGGYADRLLPPTNGGAGPSPSSLMANNTEYRVLPLRDVPVAWWNDPALAIERYIENPAQRIYRITVIGESVVVYRMTNPHLLKKVKDSTTRETFRTTLSVLTRGHADIARPVCEATVRYVEASGLDFGALDIVEDGSDHPHIIDANATSYGNFTFGLRSMMAFRRGLADLVLARTNRPSPYWQRVQARPLTTLRLVTGEARRLQRVLARR
jgi:hypothetical protein